MIDLHWGWIKVISWSSWYETRHEKLTLSQTDAEFVQSSNCLQVPVVNLLDLNWVKMMKYAKHGTSIH